MSAVRPSAPWRGQVLAVAARKGRAVVRLFTNPQYRSRVWFRLAPPRNLFQPDGTTGPDRYPDLFACVRRNLPDAPSRRILSFGCSTGDEVFNLRDDFPAASLKGLDINRGSIALCNARLKKCPDARMSFAVADSAAHEAPESYDAIFCMSVLRHGELGRTGALRCDHLIRFADFETTVAGLARCLKPGGLLAIANSNFRFRDTAAFADFELILEAPSFAAGRTPVYGRDNRHIPGAFCGDHLFRKRRATVSRD